MVCQTTYYTGAIVTRVLQDLKIGVLSYWSSANKLNLLILNGSTPGNEYGQFTFQTAQGHSTIDNFIASAQCMTAVQSLHVHEQASRYHSDPNPLFLHSACESLTHAPIPTPSAESDARMRYDVQERTPSWVVFTILAGGGLP